MELNVLEIHMEPMAIAGSFAVDENDGLVEVAVVGVAENDVVVVGDENVADGEIVDDGLVVGDDAVVDNAAVGGDVAVAADAATDVAAVAVFEPSVAEQQRQLRQTPA
jgi:hypothetical protein